MGDFMFLVFVILFFVSPLIGLFASILALFFTKKPYRYCILIALSLAIIAYFFEPTSAYDLYRIFEKVTWLKEMSINHFLQMYIGNIEIGFNFCLYVISNLLNEHFIPAIFCFIGYMIMFYIICDYAQLKQMSSFNVAFTVLIFLLSYQHMLLISGIRNFIAMIFFVFLLYVEKIKGKENIFTHLLYIVPVLFHSSMIFFVLIRILLLVKEKFMDKLVIVMAILIAVAPRVILQILSLFQTNALFSTLYDRLNNYLLASTSNFYSTLILLAMFFQLTLYIYLYWYVQKKKSDVKQNKFYRFVKYILILTIGMIPYTVVFDRMLIMLSCLTVILLVDYLNLTFSIKKINKFFCYGVIFLVALFLFRNQLYNYYLDLKSAILNSYENSVTQIIEMRR